MIIEYKITTILFYQLLKFLIYQFNDNISIEIE